MQYKTHVLFGIVLGLIFQNFSSFDVPLYFFFVIFGSLLPDIDHPKSKIGRWFKPIGWLFEHRGFFHSFFVPLIFSVVLFRNGFGGVMFPLALGYVSHLVLDATTKKGIMPLHPMSRIKIRGPFKTGGFVEQCLLMLLSLYIIVVLFF